MKPGRTLWIGCTLILFVGCTPSPKPVPAPAPSVDPIETVQSAAQKTPSFENQIALGMTYSSQGKHEEALKAFQRALSTSPRSPLAFNNICSEFNEMKHWRLAAENCQKALELEPGYVLARNNLAHAQKSKALLDAKTAELEKNVNSGKNPDRNRIDLGMVFYTHGEYDRAVETWTAVPEKSEVYAVAQNNLATVHILTRKFELAKACLSHALEREPKNQLYLNNLKWLQTASQEPAR